MGPIWPFAPLDVRHCPGTALWAEAAFRSFGGLQLGIYAQGHLAILTV
jgi:hypothetical protein